MTLRLNGSTSGYVELDAPAIAGATALTLPTIAGTLAVQGYAYGQSATATVATSQSTTSTSYTDLATVGPSVTLTTGTKALVVITSNSEPNLANYNIYTSVAISGATTVAASDTRMLRHTNRMQASAVYLVTGLAAGSNTFTLKYRAESGSTATFSNREITVIDLGS